MAPSPGAMPPTGVGPWRFGDEARLGGHGTTTIVVAVSRTPRPAMVRPETPGSHPVIPGRVVRGKAAAFAPGSAPAMLHASHPGLVETDLPRPDPFSLDRLVHEPSPVDRASVVAVVAHPDDEVLGCGLLLSRHGGARVVHVTDGSPADGRDAARLGFASPAAYARARRGEVEAAMRLAGLDRSDLHDLGVADQAAAHGLRALARRLAPLLRGTDVVLTHAYEGGHPDHDATAFAVHAALHALGSAGPALVEMPFYRAGPAGWVRQAFWPEPGAGPEVALHPTGDERRLKRRMLDAHASQAAVLAGFPIGPERFRLAPPYDFGAAPNGGLVLYARYDWGTTPAQWADRVRAALGPRPGA